MTNKVVFHQHEIFVSLTLYPVYYFLSSRLLSLFLLTVCPLFHLHAVEILQEMKSGEREHNTFFLSLDSFSRGQCGNVIDGNFRAETATGRQRAGTK